MLTKKDALIVEEIVDRKLDEKLEDKFEEKLKFLPSKEEFYSSMDEIMGELKAIREENEILNHRTSNHEDRLEKLENLHPSTHSH